jgi:hypothetical protein
MAALMVDFDGSGTRAPATPPFTLTPTPRLGFRRRAGFLNYYGSGGWTAGGETRTSFGNFSVQGSIGYASFDTFSDFETWSYQVGASYFFNPNLALNAGVALHEFDYGSGDAEMTDLSIGGAYGFGNGFEVYGSYLTSDIDFNTGSDAEVDTWNLGVRYHFNGGTLQDNANDGASWSAVRAISDALTRFD